MKQKTVIETRIEELKDYDWLYYEEDDDIEFVEDNESINKAAALWKMTPEAVKAIKGAFDSFAEVLIDNLKEDLQDLWEEIQEVKYDVNTINRKEQNY